MPAVAAVLPSPSSAPDQTEKLPAFAHLTSSAPSPAAPPAAAQMPQDKQPQQQQQHNPHAPEAATAPGSIIDILGQAIDDGGDDDEYDYEALPENTSVTANLIAGASAGIMVRPPAPAPPRTIH